MPDVPRSTALAAMKAIRLGAFANIAVGELLAKTQMSWRDAAFVTDMVYDACRRQGTLDAIVEAASGRKLTTLQPAVLDVLRLGAEQLLAMRVPAHAAISTSVDLAASHIGVRVKGVVNAILRRISLKSWQEWIVQCSVGRDAMDALGLRTCHPRWIVEAYAEVLPTDELEQALLANNATPIPTLVARPGLISRDDLMGFGGEPTPYSPWGVIRPGDPGQLEAVRHGLAGVQDEGSQVVAGLLAGVGAPSGPWLDMCAGPGGKAALLTGLARERGESVIAAELHPHRAELVAQSLRAYSSHTAPPVMVADATVPSWGRVFARVLVDAPCTGLGALRRRPEARWRKSAKDVDGLVPLQMDLVKSAISSTMPGGVVAYVTCSPHRRETVEVVHALERSGMARVLNAPALLKVAECASGLDDRAVQLWPHRHGTDAMFAALFENSGNDSGTNVSGGAFVAGVSSNV